MDRLAWRYRRAVRLPNVGVLGSYEFITQTIYLSSVMARHFRAAQNPNATATERLDVLGVAAHEATHWLDHLSTSWGQRNLITVFDAINAVAAGGESEFWRMKAVRLASLETHLPAYYSTRDETIQWDGRTWESQFTIGRRFGRDGRLTSDPILFSRFRTRDGKQVARAPFSVATLLESRAVAAELKFEVAEILKLPKDQREVQSASLSKRYAERLYHPRLCVYSACAHAI